MSWTYIDEHKLPSGRTITPGRSVDVRTRYRTYHGVVISEIRIAPSGVVEICSWHHDQWRCFRAADIIRTHNPKGATDEPRSG